MLPNLHHQHAVFFALEPEPRPNEELNTQSQGRTPFIYEGALATISGKILLGSEKACYYEKVCGYHCRGGAHDA